MSMELLGSQDPEEFYSVPEANRARRTDLENVMDIFPWIATVDAFQHWIYTHPGHNVAERKAAWLGLMERFGGASIGADMTMKKPVCGTDNSTFLYTRFTISNMGLRNSGHFRSGPILKAIRSRRWRSIKKP